MARYAILALFGFILLCSSVNADSNVPWDALIWYPDLQHAEQCQAYLQRPDGQCLFQLCDRYTTVARDSMQMQIAPAELFHYYNQKYFECVEAERAL